MDRYFDTFAFDCAPLTNEKNVIVRNDIRISVLTEALVRFEHVKGGSFCDKPTQSVWFRSFSSPRFEVTESGSKLTVKTPRAQFTYSLSGKRLVSVSFPDGKTVSSFKKGNLGGTCRTLDFTNGKTKIGDGVISESGVALLDDSDTLVLGSDGTFAPRDGKGSDVYCFAYAHDYIGALRDLFMLTGKPPLVPRFALGNWWSRYKAYTAEEYLALMQRFIDEKIPVTVATVDMDWHWVKIREKFPKVSSCIGKRLNFMELVYDTIFPGWTGYSWNTELFPDPQGFLDKLKEQNFRITLNVHPAAGVFPFENKYREFCEFMGLDPEKNEQYRFDITDEKFVEGYFRFMIHPHEDAGVDFWWLDWQQGKKTKLPGLDPLWALNHYHSLDSARDGKRPLILSRFAGAGSQRYPLGFSGDSAQTWKALDFQPYFTANATNIGYTWWSHDIGGHCNGIRDDELYLRWVQFGVFSPIMRLHSTNNEFMGKEPWKYRDSVRRCATEALRFRHRLIPYIYSMNRRTASQGRALCEPMYYNYPEDKNAYTVPNEYFFGSELIACPVTQPADKHTALAAVKVWLPEGRYTDIFTNRIYEGNKALTMFRDESSVPVLAREGAIIPLAVRTDTNCTDNPAELEILIFRGNNTFRLYEDDGETLNFENGAWSETPFTVTEGENNLCFTIGRAEGDLSVIPPSRDYTLTFRDVKSAEGFSVTADGMEKYSFTTEESDGCVRVNIFGVSPADEVTVLLSGTEARHSEDKKEALINLISRVQGKNNPKSVKYTSYVIKGKRKSLPKYLDGAAEEIGELY